jgi:hypothetical protein
MNEAALVTLAVGEPHLSNWRRYCEPGWRAYAAVHGFDVFAFTEPLDRSARGLSRSVAWQKCLLLGQEQIRRYRQVVLLDADIAINPAAPSVIDQTRPGSVGGVVSGGHIQEDLRIVLLNRLAAVNKWPLHSDYMRGSKPWEAFQSEAYAANGLAPSFPMMVQTGVLVTNPEFHRELFEAVYATDRPTSDSRCYEQVPLSHALLSANIFEPIDSRFNSVLFETLLVHHHYLFTGALGEQVTRAIVRAEMANNFFLHFAYEPSLMRFLDG